MAKLTKIKTQETTASVLDFVHNIADSNRRQDCIQLLEIFRSLVPEKPSLWNNNIIGYGNRNVESPTTGRKVAWFKIGFAPRKSNVSIYLMTDFSKKALLLQQLGKHKTGVGCLYIQSLRDVNLDVLKKLIIQSVQIK